MSLRTYNSDARIGNLEVTDLPPDTTQIRRVSDDETGTTSLEFVTQGIGGNQYAVLEVSGTNLYQFLIGDSGALLYFDGANNQDIWHSGNLLNIGTTDASARTALALGSLATLNTINNGNWSGTDLAVVNGGTGASDAPTARTNLGFADGTYTPTLTNGANVAASTAFAWTYARIGNTVVFSGRVNIDPTAAGADTVVEISLPIASNFGAAIDANGTATNSAASENATGYLQASAANDRLVLTVNPVSTANRGWFVSGTYRVI